MSKHPDKPALVRIPPDLCARVDQARGDIPRERWIRRTIEAALAQDWALIQAHETDLSPQRSSPSPTDRTAAFRQATSRPRKDTP